MITSTTLFGAQVVIGELGQQHADNLDEAIKSVGIGPNSLNASLDAFVRPLVEHQYSELATEDELNAVVGTIFEYARVSFLMGYIVHTYASVLAQEGEQSDKLLGDLMKLHPMMSDAEAAAEIQDLENHLNLDGLSDIVEFLRGSADDIDAIRLPDEDEPIDPDTTA